MCDAFPYVMKCNKRSLRISYNLAYFAHLAPLKALLLGNAVLYEMSPPALSSTDTKLKFKKKNYRLERWTLVLKFFPIIEVYGKLREARVDLSFPHHQQGRIEFNTINPSLSAGKELLIHSL